MKESKKEHAELATIIETTERIRSNEFGAIPQGLVRDLLVAHADAAATSAELTRTVEQLVKDFLEGKE